MIFAKIDIFQSFSHFFSQKKLEDLIFLTGISPGAQWHRIIVFFSQFFEEWSTFLCIENNTSIKFFLLLYFHVFFWSICRGSIVKHNIFSKNTEIFYIFCGDNAEGTVTKQKLCSYLLER